MTIGTIYTRFEDAIDSLDLELLIAHVLKKDRVFVLAHHEHKISLRQEKGIQKLIKNRLEGMPLAYLLGYKEFYSLDFIVDENVLVPRPESELLVQLVVESIQRKGESEGKRIITDVGTGSGNLIISIATHMKNSKLPITNYELLASDISEKALRVAKRNARKHGVEKNITFCKGNLLSPVVKILSSITDPLSAIYIVANLPYVDTAKRKDLITKKESASLRYEPKVSLWSGQKGLAHYKRLLQQTKNLQKKLPTSTMTSFYEIDPSQKSIAKEIEKVFPTAKVSFKKDLAGKYRVCRATI